MSRLNETLDPIATRHRGATATFGWRVYGVGVMSLWPSSAWRWETFDPGQPVPEDFPGRAALAHAAALFMLVAGAAIEWRRTARLGRRGLDRLLRAIVVILMNGRVVLAHYAEFGAYSGAPSSSRSRRPG